jgi:hypothetical protein
MTNDGIHQVTDPSSSDLAQLRADFPGWSIGVHWTAANSGPDRRRFWAVRNSIALSAWSAADLRRGMVREES